MKKDDRLNQSNVIDFPVPHPHRDRRVNRLNFDASPKTERNKIMISASLISILFLIVLFNRSMDHYAERHEKTYTLNTGLSTVIERRIASAEQGGITVGQDLLSERLASSTQRASASIGRKPTAQESFVYGDFVKYRSQYLVVFDDIDQHLVSMNYIPHSSSNDFEASVRQSETHEKKMLKSTPEAFFLSYRSAFPKKAMALVSVGEPVKVGQDLREQVYHLLDSEKKVIAKIKFTMTGHHGEYLYAYQLIN